MALENCGYETLSFAFLRKTEAYIIMRWIAAMGLTFFYWVLFLVPYSHQLIPTSNALFVAVRTDSTVTGTPLLLLSLESNLTRNNTGHDT
jgi:hypothetical protein